MAKGPFMEFLRGRITQTVLDTYAQTEIRTPASKTEKMALLIHLIEFHGDDVEGVPPAYASVTGAILDRTSTAIRAIFAPETLAFFWRFRNMARYSTLLSDAWDGEDGERIQHFDPPILYAKDSMWLAIDSVGSPSMKTMDVRIGYTLEKVSSEDFISALVE